MAAYLLAIFVLSTGVYAAVAPSSFSQTTDALRTTFQTAVKSGLASIQQPTKPADTNSPSEFVGTPTKATAETTGDIAATAIDKPLQDVATKKHPLDEQSAVIKRTKELMTISSGKQQDKKETVETATELVDGVSSTLLGTLVKKDPDEKDKKQQGETDSTGAISDILDDTELVDEELVQDKEKPVDEVVDPITETAPVASEPVETITETVNPLLP